ncbi:hypothetical protein Tco_0472939 [Tanacetum coccineum]
MKSRNSSQIQQKEVSSTASLEENPKIQAFRRELEEIALKHLGTVPENNTTSTSSVNTGSHTVNTGRLEHDDSLMPELEIYHNPETGIFDEASNMMRRAPSVYRNKRDERGVDVRYKARLVPKCTHKEEVTPKDSPSQLQTRESSRYLKGKPTWAYWYPRESPYYLKAFSDVTSGRTIGWPLQQIGSEYEATCKLLRDKTATANTNADGTLEIKATIDTIRYTISEASIRDSLQLADASGGNCFLSDSVKRKNLRLKVRKSQDDPQDSSVQGLVTPSTTKVKASGEEQEEDISPNTLEAAKTLSKVASLKTSLDFQEEVDAGAEQVNTASAEQVSTAEGVNTGSIKLSTGDEQLSTGNEQVSTVGAKKSTSDQDKGQREGKAPMISEETPKKSKEQVLQEEASLAEAIRLDTLQKEESNRRKRKAQVQFEAQHYTNEDWDLIRAKIEANAELSKSMLGSEVQGEDFAKKMVDLVNQRKKYFAEERARAKRNKPMTQSIS